MAKKSSELVNLPSVKDERWGGLGGQKFSLEVEGVCLLAAITPACELCMQKIHRP